MISEFVITSFTDNVVPVKSHELTQVPSSPHSYPEGQSPSTVQGWSTQTPLTQTVAPGQFASEVQGTQAFDPSGFSVVQEIVASPPLQTWDTCA